MTTDERPSILSRLTNAASRLVQPARTETKSTVESLQMPVHKQSISYGRHTLTLETGRIACQATGAVLVSLGDTVVLVTVVASKEAKPGVDFFPLMVVYQERIYSAGRFPGGYFRREGRPTEKETLTSRLIDRPIRPLFPKGYHHDIQVIATVLSVDPQIDPDIPALIGASAALALSGLPFAGPVAAARVGYINGAYVLNPSAKMLLESQLDLVVSGTERAVLMVESEAKELSEEIMLGAVKFGHNAQKDVIKLIREWSANVAKPTMVIASHDDQLLALDARIKNDFGQSLQSAYYSATKAMCGEKLKTIYEQAYASYVDEASGVTQSIIKDGLERVGTASVREKILSDGIRMDGRDTKTVRPISVEASVLPRTHGSALFRRGAADRDGTQALVVVTLGTGRDAQSIESLMGELKDEFLFHYNFPPYSVGETGNVGSPKRREIGHGRLAKRAMIAVLPTKEAFPYVLRVVSEITESNGSSSMASVCGSSMALMDAGVPIKAPVAGVAMGLIKEGDRFAVLTDILGDEDHLGDMDFKVAGTTTGVTALQMDIKIDGITHEIMQCALDQAHEARLHILSVMETAISTPRQDISNYAPRIITIKISPDKIRDVIGKGGATIRALTEETGTTIDITDDGVVKIAAVDGEAGQEACRRIMALTAEMEVGAVYRGRVAKIVEFGAFVTVLPLNKDGLVHISQIKQERVENVADVLQEGQEVNVKVLEIDRQGKVRLSMKEVEQ